MSDEATQATEEELHEAAAMGWADKDKWRGDQKDGVDAKAFLERGRSIMPMLQKNNERLVGKLSDLEGRLGAAEGALRAANATIKALEESQAEDVKWQREGRFLEGRGRWWQLAPRACRGRSQDLRRSAYRRQGRLRQHVQASSRREPRAQGY